MVSESDETEKVRGSDAKAKDQVKERRRVKEIANGKRLGFEEGKIRMHREGRSGTLGGAYDRGEVKTRGKPRLVK